MHLATLIFALTYILISLGENSPRKLDRPTAALLGAVLMLATGALTRAEAAAAVDFRTLSLLFGMMTLLAVLMQSGLPAWLALKMLERTNAGKNPSMLLALVVFASGAGSALMLNDNICLLGTPLLLEIAEQAGLPPMPFLIALATGSNIGSVMTLTGNPQNMIIAQASGIGWSAFALRMIPIGLLCLLADWGILLFIFRNRMKPGIQGADLSQPVLIDVRRNLAVKSVCAFAGLIIAFLAGAPMDIAALVAAIGLLVWLDRPPREALEAVDWPLLLFFTGLFVVVGGLVKADGPWLEGHMAALGGRMDLAGTVRLSIAAIIGSNLFSNVPFVLILRHWVEAIGSPHFVWLALALASTFAGNLTLFGSVANVIVAQGAGRKCPLGFADFLRAGVPVTLVTTAIGVAVLLLYRIAGWL
ncbi:MAG: SLC13 family permease [Actinomycetota bacterium]|nr:SLC13 family permease [Actinomycetota bacterium]